jgi:hypothetical protein
VRSAPKGCEVRLHELPLVVLAAALDAAEIIATWLDARQVARRSTGPSLVTGIR